MFIITRYWPAQAGLAFTTNLTEIRCHRRVNEKRAVIDSKGW